MNNRRGGIHSKFSCPIRSENDDSNAQYSNETANNQNQNVDMSHLKNIDQKLIEIIQSEVEKATFFKAK